MGRLFSPVTALIAALALAGCAGAPAAQAPAATLGALTISDPWVRPADPGAPPPTAMPGAAPAQTGGAMEMGAMVTTGGYLTVANGGAEADFLVAAAAPAGLADAVELHTVIDEGGMMRMRPVERIEVPAGGEVQLRPGSFHLMFVGVRQALRAGDTVRLSLSFEKAGTVEVDAVVRPGS